MLSTFLAVLPFALAAAISPMMLTEQTLLLAGSNGKVASRRYAIAAGLVLLVFVALLVFFGRAISLPQEPKLNARLDIVIGVLLVGVAWLLGRKPGKRNTTRHRPGFASRGAYAFGAFSMATNFTSLALIIPASKAIAASDTSFPERETLILVLVFIVTTPAWLPLALTAIAPGPAARLLSGIATLIKTRGRQLTRLLLLVLGVVLIGHGVLHFV